MYNLSITNASDFYTHFEFKNNFLLDWYGMMNPESDLSLPNSECTVILFGRSLLFWIWNIFWERIQIIDEIFETISVVPDISIHNHLSLYISIWYNCVLLLIYLIHQYNNKCDNFAKYHFVRCFKMPRISKKTIILNMLYNVLKQTTYLPPEYIPWFYQQTS